MKKRIVKALNANNEVVYVIQIRNSVLFVQYWQTYSKKFYVKNGDFSVCHNQPIEFKTLDEADAVLKQLEDIKIIL